MRRWLMLMLWFFSAGAAWAADLTLYERDDFGGRRFEVEAAIDDFARYGFSDSASSLIITRGNWQVCGERSFRGRCIVLGPGRFSNLAAIGLDNRISSVRPAGTAGGGGGGRGDDIEFFQHDDFRGRRAGVDTPVTDFHQLEMNDEVSSVIVHRRSWELCSDADFRGRCMVLDPGRYRSLNEIGLNDKISSARPSGRGGITLFEHDQFQGREVDSDRDLPDFVPLNFNDRVSSVVIERGRWQLCEHTEYRGRCVELMPGRYASLRAMGLNDSLSSARRLDGWGGGRPPGGGQAGPIGMYAPELAICRRELEDRIRRERPDAGRVQLNESEVQVASVSSDTVRLLGNTQYELPRGLKRVEFSCTYSNRSGRITAFTWEDGMR